MQVVLSSPSPASSTGDYWPIWGTCQGMQALSILSSNNDEILKRFEGVGNISLPLTFDSSSLAKSRMFYGAPEFIVKVNLSCLSASFSDIWYQE